MARAPDARAGYPWGQAIRANWKRFADIAINICMLHYQYLYFAMSADNSSHSPIPERTIRRCARGHHSEI